MVENKFRVIAMSREPAEIIKISFEPISGEKFLYEAGQFLTLIFRSNAKEIRRSYSFCSSPAVNEPISIAVKLVENGEISRLLHHQLQIGDEIEVGQAGGQFVYTPRPDTPRTLFLFAAGVGITPLFSILKTVLLREKQTKLVLVYSSRHIDETPFANEIEVWHQTYPGRLSIIHLYSQSRDLRRARLNGMLINSIVSEELQWNREDAMFYTCGPVDYMDVCRITLLSAGFKAAQIKRETFVLHEDEVDEDDQTEKVVDKNTYAVTLHFNGQKHEIIVPYPKRILEVALENKIYLPYSCSGGVCSTCAATCIAGGVRMDYNEVLTDDEIANGRVLVCTGHPTQNGTTIVWKE